jgi:TAT-translocated FGD2 family F420-dependent dehydrogenase
MTAIGFALSHEQFAAPQLIELGVAAEEAGFDMVWTSDHFHPWMHNQGHSGQAWVTLGALGQRIGLPMGTGVTCPTYRYHPAVVAQAFASLGILYPGRIFLGVGSGEAVNEQAATGQWGDYDERHDRLVEAVTLIRELWKGEWTTHNGRYYQVENAHLYDLPDQPVPIYIAAGGSESMFMAGQYGDGLISDAKSASDSEMRTHFQKGAQTGGKDASRMTIHAEMFVVVGGDAEAKVAADYWRFTAHSWDKYVDFSDPRKILEDAERNISDEEATKDWVVGDDPEVHIEAIRKAVKAGVTHIYIHSGQPDQQAVIDFYRRDVLPRLDHSWEPMKLATP